MENNQIQMPEQSDQQPIPKDVEKKLKEIKAKLDKFQKVILKEVKEIIGITRGDARSNNNITNGTFDRDRINSTAIKQGISGIT